MTGFWKCNEYNLCLQSAVFAAEKPNTVLLLSDDQDLLLGGMFPMSQILVVWKYSFVSTPVCGGTAGLHACMHINASCSDFEKKSMTVY